MNKYEDVIHRLRAVDYHDDDYELRNEAANMIEELIKAPPHPKHYTIKAEAGIIGLKPGG